MTPDSVGPLSRPLLVGRIPAGGADVVLEASGPERDALAADLDIVGIDRLVARLHVSAGRDRVRVTGRVEADIRQTCVVTLDEFPSRLDEEVTVEFSAAGRADVEVGGEVEADLDAPDRLIDERIDLGAVTAEFLALGLDPYPRKPGATFETSSDEGGTSSAFGALADFKTEKE